MKRFSFPILIAVLATWSCSVQEPAPVPAAASTPEISENNAKIKRGPDLQITEFRYLGPGRYNNEETIYGYNFGVTFVERNAGNEPAISAINASYPADEITIYLRTPSAVATIPASYNYKKLYSIRRTGILEPGTSWTPYTYADNYFFIAVNRSHLPANRSHIELALFADGNKVIEETDETNNLSPIVRIPNPYYVGR